MLEVKKIKKDNVQKEEFSECQERLNDVLTENLAHNVQDTIKMMN